MRRRIVSATMSGGSATFENSSPIILSGNSATACVRFLGKFTRPCDVRNSRIEIRESIHDVTIQRCNGLVILAFVFFRRYDPIFYSIGAEHYRAEVEEEKAETPTGRCESGQ